MIRLAAAETRSEEALGSGFSLRFHYTLHKWNEEKEKKKKKVATHSLKLLKTSGKPFKTPEPRLRTQTELPTGWPVLERNFLKPIPARRDGLKHFFFPRMTRFD